MSAFDWRARVRDLWAALDRIQEHGFSLNPLDVLRNVAALRDLVAHVWQVATEPPPGDPAAVEAAAVTWRRLGDALDARAGDLGAARGSLPTTWRGDAADGCDRTLRLLGDRFDDAASLARRAARILSAYADELTTARRRHADAAEALRAARDRIGPCAPWEWADLLGDVVRSVREAVDAVTSAYERAGRAAEGCEGELATIADRMPFPTGDGVPALTAFDLLDRHTRDETKRPLVGDTADRARQRYESLSAADQAEVDRLLAGLPTSEHRAWLLAALAGGADVTTLGRFAGRIDDLPPDALADVLDPTSTTLQQQSTTTCGSASLVFARMLNDPVYALRVLDGYDATTGSTDTTGKPDDRFAAEELAAKARTNDARDGSGGWSMPWPDAIGTSPWGAAEEMNGAAGVPGTGYGVGLVESDSPDDRRGAYQDLARAADQGRVSPLYVGDDASPRHVVLVVGRTEAGLQVYEPGRGVVVTVSEDVFVSGDVSVLGGWSRPWATVAP